MVTIYLEDVANKLYEVSDDWDLYLNVATGSFEALSTGLSVEMDAELAARIECSNDYIRLPKQSEIHEYHIMAAFASMMDDMKKQDWLFDALCGKKPFRHFKDAICYLGLDRAYYAYRDQKFLEIARDWCDVHHIPYTTRESQL